MELQLQEVALIELAQDVLQAVTITNLAALQEVLKQEALLTITQITVGVVIALEALEVIVEVVDQLLDLLHQEVALVEIKIP